MFAFGRKYYPILKRAMDLLVGLLFFTALLVPMMIIWLAVRLTSKGPGLFWSERVGRNGRIFRMPKFRTMTTCSKVMSRELAGADDCKMTPIGQFLRNTSLDEVPQFWSVIMGHMSLIGPRPVLASDLAAELRASCEATMSVRPGITGLAQINGRNFVTPRRKVRYDAFYAREMCLVLDMKILMTTIGILHRHDLVK
ncbi:MAG: sugar transferase [Litorimonas sp.]